MTQFEKKQTNSESIVIVYASKCLDQETHTHKAKNVLDQRLVKPGDKMKLIILEWALGEQKLYEECDWII